ncbi:MAG: NUDIX domain-containing protein [Firmicutes bacterium]|nr:NUDIX domain-containing protein [Bacillota bacterium]
MRWLCTHFVSAMKWRVMRVLRFCPASVQATLVWLAAPKFLITVAVVILRDNRVFLARHRDRARHPLGVITGFVEHGETPYQAAVRELTQETGHQEFDIDALKLVKMHFVEARKLEVVFGLPAPAGFPQEVGPSLDNEIENGMWYGLGELPPGVTPQQRLIIEEAVSALRPIHIP